VGKRDGWRRKKKMALGFIYDGKEISLSDKATVLPLIAEVVLGFQNYFFSPLKSL
jgi:hypothetical protein